MKMSYINLTFKSISSDCINNVPRMTKYNDGKKNAEKTKKNPKKQQQLGRDWEFQTVCTYSIEDI